MKWLILLLLLTACGPNPSYRPHSHHFDVAVHNQDIGYPASVTVTWWHGSSISGSEQQTIPSQGVGLFDTHGFPDGFQVDALAFGQFGRVWSSPEYRDSEVFHIYYPQGTIAPWPK